MTIWELRCAAVNDYAMLVPLDRDDVEEDTFDASGTAKHWKGRPLVGFHVEKRRKAQKPRADVSLLIPGALVLGEKAHAALGSFLSTFGQLLELDCHGETRYFYNMTQIVSCIDKDRSELFEDGGIMREGRFCVTPRFCCCASYDLLFCKCSPTQISSIAHCAIAFHD